jgi:hypothetical protein
MHQGGDSAIIFRSEAVLSFAPVSDGVYTWTFPGCPSPVILQLSVVGALARLAESSSGAQQGALVGFSSGSALNVDNWHPIGSLSVEDLKNSSNKKGAATLGWYRIRDGDSLSLTEEELQFASDALGAASLVLLVERRAGAAEGCFFLRDQNEGSVLNIPLLPFPLDVSMLRVREAQRRSHLDDLDEVRNEAALPANETKATRPKRHIGVMIAVLVAVSVGGAALWLSPSLFQRATVQNSNQAVRRISLNAVRQGADWRVSWDAETAELRNATTARFGITDGGQRREHDLTAEELRTGAVMYAPFSDEVSFSLTVLSGRTPTAQGSVIILGGGKSDQPRADGNDSARKSVSGTVFEAPPRANKAPLRPFTAAEKPRRSEGADVTLPDMPSLAAPTPTAVSPSVDTLGGLSAPPPEPRTDVSAPVSTPASLIFNPGFRIPQELAAIVRLPLTVRVRAWVDVKGRVTRAEPLADSGQHAVLLKAAYEAAFRCQFRPATLNAKAVAAEVVISFRVDR